MSSQIYGLISEKYEKGKKTETNMQLKQEKLSGKKRESYAKIEKIGEKYGKICKKEKRFS